jgi:porphobilinogen deaminase
MPTERHIIICTRGSALALAQSNLIAAQLGEQIAKELK